MSSLAVVPERTVPDQKPGADTSDSESWPELKAVGRLSKLVEHLGAQIIRARNTGEPAPRLVGRYPLHRALGRGAFGVVMAGEDAVLNRPVAIKLIPIDPDHPGYAQRMLREGRALALLDDPGVVRVFDCGVTELEVRGGVQSTIYIVMERLEGQPLGGDANAGLGLAQNLALLAEAARGLQRVHGAGLVHRDIKPANLLVTNEGKAVWVDFGLARAAELATQMGAEQLAPSDMDTAPEAVAKERLGAYETRVAGPVGTPAYMAPEVRIGWEASPESDQWSLAVLAWERLTGHRPRFEDGKVSQPRWWRMPKELHIILAKALNPVPANRLESVGVLADALAAWSPAKAARRQRLGRAARLLGLGLVAAASLPLWAPLARAGLVAGEAGMTGVWESVGAWLPTVFGG